MASKFFQSFRKQSNPQIVQKRDFTLNESQGKYFNVKNTDYGFIEEPSSVSYDPILELLAIINKDGKIQIFGKPGFLVSGYVKTNSPPLQIYFVPGTFKIIILTITDDIHVIRFGNESRIVSLVEEAFCPEISIEMLRIINSSESYSTSIANITAMTVSSDGCYIYIGNECTAIAIIQIEKISQNLRLTESEMYENKFFRACMKDQRSSQYLSHINGAVVILLERPGHQGQLLVGFSTGLCLIMDYRKRNLIALLPWNHHLESAAWCGGSGYPTSMGQTAATPPCELGDRLICSFSDGSMSVWPLQRIAGDNNVKFIEESVPILTMEQAPLMPYGPFPCEKITKVLWLPSSGGGITALIGGMPSSTYKEKSTISLLRGTNIDNATKMNMIKAHRRANEMGLTCTTALENINKMPPVQVFDPDAPEHVCFELSSKLIDAIPIGPACGPIQGLFLLCKEEALLIDLESEKWPLFKLPYLNCLQSSPIISMHLASDVNQFFIDQLNDYAKIDDNKKNWSTKPWPIQGGDVEIIGQKIDNNDLNQLYASSEVLFTGHQSGHVNIWLVGPNGCLRHVYSLNTARYFENEFGALNHQGNEFGEENSPWPPFRNIGSFDPYFDDVRTGVKVVKLVHNTLIVGTVSGIVTIWKFDKEIQPIGSFNIYRVTLVRESSSFSWKGQKPLKIIPMEELEYFEKNTERATAELTLSSIVQIYPPAPITCISAAPIIISDNEEIGQIIGIGTTHGYTLIFHRTNVNKSYTQDTSPNIILKVCTLPLNFDALKEAGHGESWASRRSKYLKQSLRDSFRRLKRNKSTSRQTVNNKSNSPANNPPEEPKKLNQTNLISDSRAGIRRTVTSNSKMKSNTGLSINSNEILDAGQIKAAGFNPDAVMAGHILGPEREITDRPSQTASNAIVKTMVLSNITLSRHLKALDSSEYPTMLFGSHKDYTVLCSLYVGTASGNIISYQLFGKADDEYRIIAEKQKELKLNHKAPIVNLSILGHGNISKTGSNSFNGIHPLNPTGFFIGKISSNQGTKHTMRMSGYLCVTSEEQIRLYLLPNFSCKYKNRITAKEGYQIRTFSIIDCPIEKPNTVFSNPFHVCFINNGGNCHFLDIGSLKNEDALSFVDENNNFALSSLFFSEQTIYANTRLSYSVGGISKDVGDGSKHGIYLGGPGQIVLFDICSVKNKDEASDFRVKLQLNPPVRQSKISQKTAENLLLHADNDFDNKNFGNGSLVYSARSKSHTSKR